MTEINYVIEGANAEKIVSASLGSVFISVGAFKKVDISKKTVEELEVVKESEYKSSKSYTVSLLFKSGERCLLLVDCSIYEAILKIWPELGLRNNRLNHLLRNGYVIVGFSSSHLASSGLGAGATQHNILLQKDLNVEKVSFVIFGDEQRDAHSHIFSA